ncbi:GxGYxYP domain-containing protein [Paenibacillus spongiae]|uniref:GxGYxYP putative glycoside hydrolase C-terminal domain-containing protein n=1 Tax=Paenibacillus spongiae TaxID=2909671 RepID=A0ABY5S858_9BACL|nr:GxGYxYP domain-containing protein [Paenibacillus spongiae]UVI29765.1 hypothetical protein L1F29_30890 [Paenibacillus spongiae]
MRTSMKTLVSLCLLLSVFYGHGLVRIGQPEEAEAKGKNDKLYIYNLNELIQSTPDMHEGDNLTAYAYDFVKMAAALQGIANRNEKGDKIYYIFQTVNEIQNPKSFQPDQYWLDKLDDPNQYLSRYDQVQVATDRFYKDLFKDFRKRVKGLVLWTDSIPATSNVASTIAGVQDYLPVRKGGELHKELKRNLPNVPEIDLERKFAGSYTTIPETDIPATGSKKNDVYLWAKAKYIDTGKVNPRYVTYAVDAYSKRKDSKGGLLYEHDLYNRMLINSDYYTANKGFFVDLSPLSDRAPDDDPSQPVGTDVDTFHQIFSSLREKAGTDVITVGGFSAWHIKYSDQADPSQPHPINAEWGMVDLISEYYAQLDADAPGLMGYANASVFRHIPLNTLKQSNDKGDNGKEFDPTKTYVAFYMGDFDSAAWSSAILPALWDNPGRGEMPLGWAVVPNLSKRAPHVYNYLYGSATGNDYFISGDNGAGYLNAIRLPSEYLSQWREYNKQQFQQFDLSIAGFVITDFSPNLPAWLQKEYVHFAPDGVGINSGPEQPFVGTTPFIKVIDMINGHSPADANKVEEGLYRHLNGNPSQKFWFFRTILADPDKLVQGVRQLQAAHPELNLEVVDPYTYYRFYRESVMANKNTDILGADFNTAGNVEELAYLYQNNGSSIDVNHRFADGHSSWSYEFDLADDVNNATVILDIENHYVISGSKDGETWTTLATADGRAPRGMVKLDISPLLVDNPTKTVYLKFNDGSTNDGWGPSLYHVTLSTSVNITEATFDTNGSADEWLYLTENNGSSIENDHRVTGQTGSFTYKFDMADHVTGGSVRLDIAHDYVVSGSSDNATWTPLKEAGENADRGIVSLDLTPLLQNNPSKTVYLKISDGAGDNARGASLWQLTLTTKSGDSLFYSGFEPGETEPDWLDSIDPAAGRLNVTGYGGTASPEGSPRSGEQSLGGNSAFRYAGRDNSSSASFAYFRVFDVDIPVDATTKLSYWFYPEQDLGRHVMVDLIFTDGSTLRDSGAVDQNGIRMHPSTPRGSIGKWNYVRSNIGQWLNGKTIDRILVGFDTGPGTGDYKGYIDDITIGK